MLVIDKPANMLSQRDRTGDVDLQSHLKEWIREKYDKPGEVFLGLVQRLDRPTRGLMVLARTSKAASRLSEQIRKRTFYKEYLAVVVGKNVITGELIHILEKDQTRKKAVVTSSRRASKTSDTGDQNIRDSTGGKPSELNLILLENRGDLSLVRIVLKTGRFHQIRAQLAAEGTHIAGDRKYGSAASKTGSKTRQLALMCHKIAFEHPTRREPMSFALGLPDEYPWNQFRQP